MMIQNVKRPIVCLVTDRSRLLTEKSDGHDQLLDFVRNAGIVGVDLIQIRENDLSDNVLVDLVSNAVEITKGTRSRIIVNNRVDVALAAGAAGVHLKSTSFSAERIRRVVPPGWLIGRSIHGLNEAINVTSAGALDYIFFGTVFESTSKLGVKAAGGEALGRIARSITVPVIAIGGIDVNRVEDIARSGAVGVAAISAFISCGQSIDEMRSTVAKIRDVFSEHAT